MEYFQTNFGVRFVEINRHSFFAIRQHLYPCPDARKSVTLDFNTKTLYYSTDYFWNLKDEWVYKILIHECAHLVATLLAPNLTNDRSFLYWEYLVAKELDVVENWSWTARTFVPKAKKSLDEYVDEYKELGIKTGNIVLKDGYLKPVAIR